MSVDPRILANDRWKAADELHKENFASSILESLGRIDWEVSTEDVDLIGKLCAILNVHERDRLAGWLNLRS